MFSTSNKSRGAKAVLAGAAAAFATGVAFRLIAGAGAREQMRGKVILVTGGSRGLGLEIARQFGRAGCLLMLVSRNREELQEAAIRLADDGAASNAQSVGIAVADLTDREQADRAVAETITRFGRVDVLVNSAGIITVAPFIDSSIETFERVMSVNFFAALYMTKAVLKDMRTRGSGRIVNIASVGGKVAVPHMLPYVAAKFALVGLSEGLHAELAQDGINVTTVCPGLMRTGSHVQAEFGGNAQAEYRWFSIGATLPGVSTSARHAARRIFQATAEGRAEITITPQAWLGARAFGIAPGLSASVAGVVNRLVLPDAVGSTKAQQTVQGGELRQPSSGLIRQWNEHLQQAHNQSS